MASLQWLRQNLHWHHLTDLQSLLVSFGANQLGLQPTGEVFTLVVILSHLVEAVWRRRACLDPPTVEIVPTPSHLLGKHTSVFMAIGPQAEGSACGKSGAPAPKLHVVATGIAADVRSCMSNSFLRYLTLFYKISLCFLIPGLFV